MDDVYSAGALVSGDKMVESTLIGGDVAKWASVIILVIGSLLAVANLPVITWLNM
jgi:glutamate synthase domain-containing protein 2